MTTGGNRLGDLTVGIRAPLGTFRQDLTQAEGAATQTGGRIGGAFSKAQTSIQNAARQVPIFGDQLAMLATPTGAATVAIGGMTAAIAGSIAKVINLEKELRPMVARSGLAAESLQVLSIAAERLGSEDGLEGVTDSVQELQLRLAEAVQDGTGPAVAAFEKLGLAAEDLIDKSPEEMFYAVITALQNLTNEADKKFLADELLGGSSEKLSGIIALEAAAFQNLTQRIEETHAIASGDALRGAAELATEMEELGQTVDKVQLKIGLALIPVLNDLSDAFQEDLNDVRVEWGKTEESLSTVPVVGNWFKEELTPAVAELGIGFEDMATSVIADSKRAFDKDTAGSMPHTYFEGFTHVVQVNQQLQTEMGRHQNTLGMMQVQANRDRISRAEELAARRLAIRQKGNEDVEEETEEHHTTLQKFTDDFWRQQLQREEEGYQARFAAQLAAYDEREDTTLAHFRQLEEQTGIHLSNIQSMYAASGVAVNASMSVMMDGLTRQVDHFIAQNARAMQSLPAMFQSAGALNPFGSGKSPTTTGFDDPGLTTKVLISGDGGFSTGNKWVDASTLDPAFLEAAKNDPGTTVKYRHSTAEQGVLSYAGGRGLMSSDIWNQWLYYLDRLAADPILAGDPRAFTRADLGLGEVGSTPPTLPGLPGFATGGIAMRPMAANIAENGPEAIIPLNRMQPTINVIFGEGAVLANDAVEFVLDALHEAERRGFR